MTSGEGVGTPVRELSDVEFLRVMLETLGVQRAGRMVVTCLYYAATGSRTYEEMAQRVEALGLSRSFRYRGYRDLRLLRDRVAELEGRAVDVDQLGRRVARVGIGAGAEVPGAAQG